MAWVTVDKYLLFFSLRGTLGVISDEDNHAFLDVSIKH